MEGTLLTSADLIECGGVSFEVSVSSRTDLGLGLLEGAPLVALKPTLVLLAFKPECLLLYETTSWTYYLSE